MKLRTACRVVFACFALAVVTATHWPALNIASHGISRLDLYVHAGTFGTWMLLFALCGFFGPALSTRNVVRSAAVALGYALIDELSQGIPILQRTVDPLDLAANSAGILTAGIALLALARLARSPAPADNQ